MGLATIDPHSQKEHTEIHKIPKFGVYQASLLRQRPDGHTFLCKFSHFQMAVSFLLLGLFTPNLGIL